MGSLKKDIFDASSIIEACNKGVMSERNIAILRLYLSLMGRKFSEKEKVFFKQAFRFFTENKDMISIALNPDTRFVFTKENKERISEQLESIDLGLLQIEAEEETPIDGFFDLLSSVVIEALKFGGFIEGNSGDDELKELEIAVDTYSNIKDKMIELHAMFD
jgi:hypothetical protein